MNQILVIDNNLICNEENLKKNKIYLYFFFISISISTILSFNFVYSHYSKINDIQKTNILKNKYNISTLYPTNSNYSTLKLSNNISIIGSIEIPKINVSYPIIENTNEDLLKVSVCKFSGPLPNRIGNLCIAGHNYKNNTMFSKLHQLNIGDSFYITDLNDTKLKYVVYNKFIVKEKNLSCTEKTKDIQVTLITCYNGNNSKRLIIKAKMEGL